VWKENYSVNEGVPVPCIVTHWFLDYCSEALSLAITKFSFWTLIWHLFNLILLLQKWFTCFSFTFLHRLPHSALQNVWIEFKVIFILFRHFLCIKIISGHHDVWDNWLSRCLWLLKCVNCLISAGITYLGLLLQFGVCSYHCSSCWTMVTTDPLNLIQGCGAAWSLFQLPLGEK